MFSQINPVLLINLLTSFMGSLTLYLIWYDVQRTETVQDKGYRYASFAVFIWALAALFEIRYPEAIGNSDKNHEFVLCIFSTLNNGFFLYSMYYFDFSPKYIHKSKTYWYRTVIITCGLVISLFITFFFLTNIYDDYQFIAIFPDILLSLITTCVLGYTFFNSFNGRRLSKMAYLSITLFFLIAITQFLSLPVFDTWEENNKDWVSVLLILTHLGVIIILITSVLGWIVERSEIPESSNIKIAFNEINGIKKNQLAVNLTIDKNFVKQEVVFTPALYLYFLKFAVCKKCRNVGLTSDEYYHENYPRRIMDEIRKVKKQIDDNKSMGESNSKDPIKNKALARWPFLFVKTIDGQELMVQPDNIAIDKNLIKQLGDIKFDGFPNSRIEVEFIKNEFGRCQNK